MSIPEIIAILVSVATAIVLMCSVSYSIGLTHGMYMRKVLDRTDKPTADVVEVVRCKDCKHYEPCTAVSYCNLYEDVTTEPNAYCSYGERRENET